jgi:hypothetical protein
VKKEVPALSRRRIVAARTVAIAVDFLQIAVFPIFLAGAASPADDALDVATGAAMVALVGWHWAFLPSFLTKLVPFADLVPTWTAAVFLATRKGAKETPARPAPAQPGAIETTLAEKD